ncbi:cell death-inducing p53-target protein 1 isoform X3 [Trachypithecus francoisi]|uniref:cell death-inducing p53-target protein 1 isoform X3 n=1 Tax=Trachypithecus francoisi TaxID=54180 RepID=UPI00141BE1A1|nr:cell death-inducing p53-target protein 1 isoform X3 [Trachypithecus francoisi]
MLGTVVPSLRERWGSTGRTTSPRSLWAVGLGGGGGSLCAQSPAGLRVLYSPGFCRDPGTFQRSAGFGHRASGGLFEETLLELQNGDIAVLLLYPGLSQHHWSQVLKEHTECLSFTSALPLVEQWAPPLFSTWKLQARQKTAFQFSQQSRKPCSWLGAWDLSPGDRGAPLRPAGVLMPWLPRGSRSPACSLSIQASS